MKKTIAQHMVDTLKETDNPAVMFGDCGLLDHCAKKCSHTNLMKLMPHVRHTRILNALDDSHFFEKSYTWEPGIIGNKRWRKFTLKIAYKRKKDENSTCTNGC